jgi:hypothetical protein
MGRELHQLGYERLRACVYNYPLAWRCAVFPKHWALQRNGAVMANDLHLFPLRNSLDWTYSSASEQQPFGWRDAAFLPPRELALRFLHLFPDMAVAGWGKDPAYVTWFSRMVDDLAPFGLPYAFAEFQEARQSLYVQFHSHLTEYPLPPPGDAEE